MKAAVVVFPGSNCDRDVKVALARSMGSEPIMVWHGNVDFPRVDLIVLPGGFSYGDYLRAGAMAAHAPVMREVVRRAEQGVALLGICNGFQILTETGLLPGVLMRNAGLKFLGKDVWVRIEATDTAFTAGYATGQVVRIPIAHNEGNYFADVETLERLEGDGLVAMRYCASDRGADQGIQPQRVGTQHRRTVQSTTDRAGHDAPSRTPRRRGAWGTDGRALFDGVVAGLTGSAR